LRYLIVPCLAKTSASMTAYPRSWRKEVTVDFPLAIPPVNPNKYITM